MQGPDGSCLVGWPRETIQVSIVGRGWPDPWVSVTDLVSIRAGVTGGRLLGVFKVAARVQVRGD